MNKKTQPQFTVFAKRKNSSDPVCNIYVRVSYQSHLHEKSLGIKCLYANWNREKQYIINDPLANAEINDNLEEFKQKVIGSYWVLTKLGNEFSLQDVIEMAGGDRMATSLSFCQCFNDVIERMKKTQAKNGQSKANIEKHERCLQHFKTFCKSIYRLSDMSFAKITRSVVDDLNTYFITDGNCSHNTTIKYLQIVKKIYRIGMDNGWVRINAFSNLKFRIKPVIRECLTEEELKRIQEKAFHTQRLDYVRDIFVFSCFTGLAYIDIKNLKRRNILELRERLWVKSMRTKTHIEASLPLLPAAKQILDKRQPTWVNFKPDDLLLDILSNQKMNEYLKEIAEACKIEKPLSFHIARYTFATTVTLMNNVPIETVSKMLGHSRITMTQHYSKVADLKIEKDTAFLINKLESQTKF